MRKIALSTSMQVALLVGTVLLAGFTLAGCDDEASHRPIVVQGVPAGQVAVVIQDDYDYYPGYEVYYSRSRHEFLYRDGNQWVRRSEPRGVTLSVLFGSPSVRMDFRDSPERHHGSVIQNYPKNWHQPAQVQPAKASPAKDAHRDPKKNDGADGKKDDQKDGNRNN